MSKNPGLDRATIRLFWKASLTTKPYLLKALLFPLGNVCIYTLAPLFLGKILAALVTPTANPYHYLPYFIGTATVGVICNRVGFRALVRYQATVTNRLRSQAFETLLRQSVSFHNNAIGGKLVSDAIDFPQSFSHLSTAVFTNLIPLAVVLLVGSAIVFSESPILGLVITAMSGYAFFSGLLDSRRRAPLRARRLVASKAVTAHIADSILNVQTVKTFAKEESELGRHHRLNKTLGDYYVSDWVTAANLGNRRIATLFLMQFAFTWVAIWTIQRDPALIGVGIFAFAFTMTITNRLFDVNAQMRTLEEAFLHASPMTQIMLSEPEILDAPQAKPLHVSQGAIAFENVDFHYQDTDSDQLVFAGLSMSIRPGEKVGLVGPSGGGKSTLTRLLLRFEDLTSGAIRIDGQHIARVTQASLREAIAYVPQEPLLFHRSIRENIAYSQSDAPLEAVEKAARMARAHEFIKDLPQGYDTIVGERGVKLSGGQRQRVAIARAILKDAPILVLDEATSALDSESELLIQDALQELMENRTTIVIAHRLSTIQKMDRIVVLEQGRIVEEGSHKQLLKKKGLYAKLWAHQSGGFIEE